MARTPAQFRRIYGSRERVTTLAMRDCDDGCGRVPSYDYPNHNAHTETGGIGYKAGWQTIVTLCADCHRLLDETYGSVRLFDEHMGTDLRETASRLAREIPA